MSGYRVTVKQASKIMGMDPDCVRHGMRNGTLPIGTARKACTGRGYRYDIFLPKLEEYIGCKVDPKDLGLEE